jgi:asparagine N-glycosylation enzyme membrane subunit Stt3
MAKSKDSNPATSEPITSVPTTSPATLLYGWVWFGAAVYIVAVIVKIAYRIRMSAIDEFGPVIHEFDPYFNYRATEVSSGRAGWVAGWNRKLWVECHPSNVCIVDSPCLVCFMSFAGSIFMSMGPKSSSSGLITWSGILWDALWVLQFTLACSLLLFGLNDTYLPTGP